ncbi:hypothetical protein V6N13_091132 [Hibiscus sabdariffa]|uniref:hAT-like transposase RNase-H fold domain-containing protein n=1 Tax=Hibiscus sabdariffa TaxID=183260 RepID=A0ABR2R366_9ROSI
MHYLLDEWLNCDDLDIVSMASKMKDKYNKYWGDATNMNFLIYLAIILDPRRKMGFVDFGVQYIFPDVASEDSSGSWSIKYSDKSFYVCGIASVKDEFGRTTISFEEATSWFRK